MPSSKNFVFFYKIFSLLSVVRGYNILVLVFAQYLVAIFIFSPQKSVRNTVLDLHLFFLILATICVIASGYIINNFYDKKIDRINRPYKASLDSFVGQNTKLKLYFFLNFVGVGFGFLVSWRSALFFSVYIFGIWFYSHKLKKYPLTGLFAATCLTLLPFFVVFIYYKNFSRIIFLHAIFLALVIMARELIKDLGNIKGTLANGYKTFPVVYGEKKTKLTVIVLLLQTLVPVVFLFNHPAISYMRYYFYFALVTIVILGLILWNSTKRREYIILHTTLKLLLLIGVLSLVFIDMSLLLDKVIEKIN